jgi:hypothetical protein
MPSPDRLLLADLDRMDDDGSQPVRCLTAVTPRVLTSDAPRPGLSRPAGGGSPAANEWYHALGVTHRRRDQAAREDAGAIRKRNDTAEVACRGRWPAVVAEMRRLLHSYNEGVGLKSLVLVEAPSNTGGELSVQVMAHRGAMLTITLKRIELCVQSQVRDGGVAEGERWIDFGRSDEAIARYILQDWMTRL